MKTRPPSFVLVAISTSITIFVWIAFEIYRIFSSSPAVDVPEEILEPISAQLDTNALDRINSSFYLTDEELDRISPLITITLTPSPTTTIEPPSVNIATEESQIQVTPTPTESF
jgi:hypothetical protein